MTKIVSAQAPWCTNAYRISNTVRRAADSRLPQECPLLPDAVGVIWT